MAKMSWKSGLAQAFFVVLGVGLAVLGNEWRESRSLKKDAKVAFQGIQEEIIANRNEALLAFNYNFDLSNKLFEFGRNPANSNKSPGLEYFGQGYIKPASFLYTAWDVAKETNALSHLEYETVLSFSSLYNDQKEYDEQAATVGDLIFSKMLEEGRERISSNYQNLSQILSTFWYRECQLLSRFDSVLEEWDMAEVSLEPIPESCRSILSRSEPGQ